MSTACSLLKLSVLNLWTSILQNLCSCWVPYFLLQKYINKGVEHSHRRKSNSSKHGLHNILGQAYVITIALLNKAIDKPSINYMFSLNLQLFGISLILIVINL